jgi:adenine-specific DNA-methyltransferase
MSAINDLISQIQDESLRDRIQNEVNKMAKQKKFGLVFEEHLPECTPLYDVPVKRGSLVVLKGGDINNKYIVGSIVNGIAKCMNKVTEEVEEIPLENLVTVAEFGEPIYPYLKPIDSICNAPDSDLWHTLIEADNYHALQLLEYLYAGKVDCIYIDPPYNTGAKDWKYNNDYVDGNDQYRHSKWLSMMQKRLKIAKKLLNPKDSVLIVTIDEKEYLHLGCLLEEMFPEANMQMVSSLISPQGNQRKNQFSRMDEYIYFVELGSANVQKLPLSDEWRINADDKRTTHLHWQQLIRNGKNGIRERSPSCFYPIYVSQDGKTFLGVGQPAPVGSKRSDYSVPENCIAIWPLHKKSDTEGCWVDRCQYSRQKKVKNMSNSY